ncbi:hypothetical protein AtNW77_Chr3g0179831 [Arabidopsis thaliana]|uniref:Retrovirus-related Pol polyprotein from transposon TNT 1-94-like beta-barrel domain-containing protein n=1 Tax=Arabidopsis thaliana TaxID=3702 RepID=A0A178V8Q7_ARATH|nr:hypothetical protein AXX17_AT3G22410 [Arabidopsis thaliana]
MAVVNLPTLQDVVSDELNYEIWAPIMKTSLAEKGLWDIVKYGIPPDLSKIPELATKIRTQDLSIYRDSAVKDTKALHLLQSFLPDSVFRKTLETTSAKHLWDLLKEDYVQAKLGMEKLPEYHMFAINVLPATFDKDITLMAEGIGDIIIMTKDGNKTIKNVLYVPGITGNALSVVQMEMKRTLANGIPPDPSKNPKLAATIQAEDVSKWREFVRKDMEALEILQFSLPDSVFRKTLSAVSAKDLWDLLNEVPDHVAECFSKYTFHENIWLISSTNSNHMTPHVKFFTTLDRSRKCKVKFISGDKSETTVAMVEGIGDVTFITNEGNKTIKNVLHVPGIEGNALSVSQLKRNGFEVSMERRTGCFVWDRTTGKMFGKNMWEKRGFCLRFSVIEGNFQCKKRKFTQD